MELHTKEQLKQRVKGLRKLYGFSQSEFAELYNIPLRSVQCWESKKNPNAPKEYLIDLMEFYYLKEGFKKAFTDED